jgi:collagen type VII alpha
MSCNNDNYNNICRQDIPYPQVSPESVPSLISNLVYALYGTINKSVVNGRVVWDIPCDPNNSAEVEQIPREEGEGLLCYLLRLFANSLDSYGQFLRWGFAGSGQTAFTLTGAYQPDRNAYLAYIDGVVQDPISYTISSTLPRVLNFDTPIPSGSFLTVVELSSRAGATGATGIVGPVGSTGATGIGATGNVGPQGATGNVGPQGATGLVGNQGATGPQGISGTAAAGGQRWAYIGNGTQDTFALSGASSIIAAGYLVAIDGVVQDPNNYSIVSGSPYTIVLSSPVPNSSVIVIVEIVGPIGATGQTGATGVAGSAGPFGGIRWAYAGSGNTNFNIAGNTTNNPVAYIVNIDGITQDPNNYSISGNTLTTSAPVPVGSEIVIVSLNGIQGATGFSGSTGATGIVGPRGSTGATGVSDVLNIVSFTQNSISVGTKEFSYVPTNIGWDYGTRLRATAVSASPFDYVEGVVLEVNNQEVRILVDRAEGAGFFAFWYIAPIGDVGSTGSTGPIGPQGTPGGATGATGASGLQGNAGPVGGQRWAYVGNGSQTIFNILGATTTNPLGYSVNIDGVTQDPNDYSIASGFPYVLTMSSPVPSGSNIVITSLNGITGATGVAGSAGPFGGIRWAYAGGTSFFDITGNTTNNPLGYLVCIDGVVQDSVNYSISGNTLTMSSPVPVGSEIVIVSLNGIQGATGIGATGATGIVGPQGATGIGSTGATGIQGISGTAAAGGQRWGYVGNGTQDTFNISGANSLIPSGYLVSIDGVVQDPNNYNVVSGSPYTIVLSSAVPSNSVIVIVEIVGPIGATGQTGATGVAGSAGPFGGLRWAYAGGTSAFSIIGNTTNNPLAYSVNIDGVTQDPNEYTISGNTLTTSSVVPSGSEIVIVSLNGIQGATGLTGATGPSGGPTGATGAASPAGGTRWAYVGNGTQSAFSVTGAISTLATAFLVAIDGVVQDPNEYTISGTTLTTSSAVPNGSQIVIVSLNGIQGATGLQGTPGGATGATGVGAQGSTGATGVGAQGSTGATGVGAQGSTGATGVGAQGSTGATGVGAQGSTGATGVLPPTNFGSAWAFTGDGIQTVFAITGGLSILAPAYLVHVDGVYQKSTNYIIDNVIPRTLTFSTPIPSGSEITIVSLSVA